MKAKVRFSRPPSNGPYHGWWGSVSLKQRRSWLFFPVAYSYKGQSLCTQRTLIKLPCCLSRFRRAGWASRFFLLFIFPDRLMTVCIGSTGMKLLSAMTSGVNITCVHYVCLFALGLC